MGDDLTDTDIDIDSFFGEVKLEVKLEVEIKPETKSNVKYVVGIDLGTTNSCVSVWRNNNLEIIPDQNGNRTTPSIVAFTNNCRYVGYTAKNQTELNPENTVYEIKRLIGRKITDHTVVNDKQFLTYKIVGDELDRVVVQTEITKGKSLFTPEEVSANILSELKILAKSYLKIDNDDVLDAVITVPAYFNDQQRQATKDAGVIAGLNVLRIINEPTAAALAYGLERMSINKDKDMNVLIYDLGGGTLDVSLVNIENGYFQVLGSTGNTHLGGADFDNRLVSYCIRTFKKMHKYNTLNELRLLSLQRLRKSCENAKKALSEMGKATIAVKDFYDGKSLLISVTRQEFDSLCKDLFILCLKPVEDVIRSCELERSDIDEVILVGGATRMKTVRENLKLFFNGKEPCDTINPDEVVAAGAAIQGYILGSGKDPFSENVVLVDVIPLSLGVQTIGGVMDVIIPRNSVIPIKRKRKYTTDSDYEQSVLIKVYEGERQMTKDNYLVGEFELKGIEPAPRGVAEITVSFNVDVNGIINVTAEDLKNTENKKSITITGNKGRLTQDEIKQLVNEAKTMEIKDRLEKEKKQLFYEIEDLSSNILVNIKNDEFKLKEKDKQLIEEDINKIVDWLKAENYVNRTKKDYHKVIERIKKKYGTLMLKLSKSQSEFKGLGEVGEATSVFADDDAEEDAATVFEQIENEEYNCTDEQSKEEIKQARNILVELCNSVLEVLSDTSVKIDSDHINEVVEFINDTLLEVYTKEKISKLEYEMKTVDVNKVCSDLMDRYTNNSVFEQTFNTAKEELEHLCCTLYSSIISNVFSVDEEQVKLLKSLVEDTVDKLSDYTDDECRTKTDQINSVCNSLYESMLCVDVVSDLFEVGGTLITSLL